MHCFCEYKRAMSIFMHPMNELSVEDFSRDQNREMGHQNFGGFFNKIKPYLAMISLQFGYAGMHIVILLSFKKGFSHWVFVVYRQAVAALVFAPFAYFLERKIRPQMTKSIFLKIMVLAFLEPVLDQNLYGVRIQYTSATFAAATVPSLAKVIGIVVTVAGAMFMTLYKGPAVNILSFSHGGSHHGAASSSADQHWVTGTIMLLGCILGWAAFFILQNNTLKEYPAELSLTALVCLLGTIQGGVVAAIMERRKSAWAVGFDSRLLAAAYSGIICSGIAYYLQSVENKVRGPVFVTEFSPLSMIITAFLGAIILAEQLHLGSIIGAVIIVFGLYSVVWGKSKENSASKTQSYDDGNAHELPVVNKNNIQDISSDINEITTVKSKSHHKNLVQQEP